MGGLKTANFNSFENLKPQQTYLNGTIASFGLTSKNKLFKKMDVKSQSLGAKKRKRKVSADHTSKAIIRNATIKVEKTRQASRKNSKNSTISKSSCAAQCKSSLIQAQKKAMSKAGMILPDRKISNLKKYSTVTKPSTF